MSINSVSFQTKIAELQGARAQTHPHRKLSVAILGAGPAGLIRGVQSLLHGHSIQIIEKRPEGAKGRSNTVALDKKSIELLKNYGVYQYLFEKRLIFSPSKSGYISVRLEDLEQALKAIIQKLDPTSTIHYDSQVKKIAANLVIKSNGGLKNLPAVDLIVNAEGSRSSTNEKLHNRRIEVLPKVPVIAAIFKDGRPKIKGFCSFFQYLGKSIAYTAISIYYYAIYFFKAIFQKENFWSKNRKIAGALILKTPGQNYLGFGLSHAKSAELMALKQQVEDKRKALHADKQNKQLEKELRQAEKKFNSFAKYWINLSFCAANVLGVLGRFSKTDKHYFNNARRLPLNQFSITEIGADHAERFSEKIDGIPLLLAGDAAATVDPTTGLGCNTALQSSLFLEKVMTGMEKKKDLDTLLAEYDQRCEKNIDAIHNESLAMRRIYRPDALYFG